MPTSTSHPIVPATFSVFVADPSSRSDGVKARARRVLARAKAIIEEKGWVQNTSTGPSGEKCLTAAISEARTSVTSKPGLLPLSGSFMEKTLAGLLEEARPKVTRRAPAFRSLDSAATWNDKVGRTKEQVLGLLDKAISG